MKLKKRPAIYITIDCVRPGATVLILTPIDWKMLALLLTATLPFVLASPLQSRWGEGVANALGTLAEARGKLYFGTAFTSFYASDPRYGKILETEFSQYTPENEMKWEVIEPERGVFNWTGSDLVGFIERWYSRFEVNDRHGIDSRWSQ